MPDRDELLGCSAVFGPLEHSVRSRLVRSGSDRNMPAGTLLFQRGDVCDEVHVLLKGRVRLESVTDDGHSLALQLCEPGEVLGQLCAVDGASFPFDATTEDDCHIISFSVAAFRDLLRKDSDLGLRLAASLAAQLRDLQEEVESMKFARAGNRVLDWLRQECATARVLRLTPAEIAERVEVSAHDVRRTLGLLRDRGLLRLGRSRVEILEHDALERAELT